MPWGKDRTHHFIVFQWKTELLVAQALRASLGSPAGCRAAERLPPSSGQSLPNVFFTAALSETKDAWDSLYASDHQEASLTLLRAEATLLHPSCCECPATLQQSALSQGGHSSHLPQSRGHSLPSNLSP